MNEKDIVEILINVCSWLYFIIWSISFYPQIILLVKTKSAMGMSANYIFINLTGYLMYSVYNLYGFFKGNNPQTGNVDLSDILFSMHSVIVYVVTVALFFYYPHKIQLNLLTKTYLILQWTVFLYFGFNTLTTKKSFKLFFFGIKTNLGYFQTLGYFKMFSTLLKHPTQIYFNFKRKSTKGWSIQGMIMDFLGGFFSLVALLLQLYLNPKLHINKAKLFLSVMSMIYDAAYMAQHFVFYGDKQQSKQTHKEKISRRYQIQKEEKQEILRKDTNQQVS